MTGLIWGLCYGTARKNLVVVYHDERLLRQDQAMLSAAKEASGATINY